MLHKDLFNQKGQKRCCSMSHHPACRIYPYLGDARTRSITLPASIAVAWHKNKVCRCGSDSRCDLQRVSKAGSNFDTISLDSVEVEHTQEFICQKFAQLESKLEDYLECMTEEFTQDLQREQQHLILMQEQANFLLHLSSLLSCECAVGTISRPLTLLREMDIIDTLAPL